MLKKLNNNLEEGILIVLLVVMTLIMGIQIASRYLLGNSLSWSEELVRYLFVWSTFIGIPFCVKKGLSIKVNQFRDILPVKIQKVLLYLDKIFIIVLFSCIFVYSIFVVKASFISNQTSPAMQIPTWIVQFSVTLGSFLTVVRSIQNLYDLFRGKMKVVKKEGLI